MNLFASEPQRENAPEDHMKKGGDGQQSPFQIWFGCFAISHSLRGGWRYALRLPLERDTTLGIRRKFEFSRPCAYYVQRCCRTSRVKIMLVFQEDAWSALGTDQLPFAGCQSSSVFPS